MDREQIYEAFDKGLISLGDIIDISQKYAIKEFKEYLLKHKHLVREFETNHLYEAVKIEFIKNTDDLFSKE